ncbi:MAG TPA: hypothetical protein DCE41_35015 [Cytophagales bacterium]|nr:hypothetical protein [Cytophagales bacterium]HAA24182.1 hypothetical protein [Cytophagales bacterium]HAP60969.1 hypothetical protein [Cytophagales bacterium]
MKNKAGLITLLVLLFGVLVAIGYFSPKPVSWWYSFNTNNTQPYDLLVLDELIPDLFEGEDIQYSRSTFFELTNLKSIQGNLFSVSYGFYPDETEYESLFTWAENGGHALVVAQDFDARFLSTLGLDYEDHSVFKGPTTHGDEALEGDSIRIHWEGIGDFYYPIHHAGISFRKTSTKGKSAIHSYEVLATNEYGNPVVIQVKEGEGSVVFSTLPMIFTNFFLLKTPNEQLVAQHFAHLSPSSPLIWTEYYEKGKNEYTNPLRFIASQRALRSGYFVLLAGVTLFILFQGKRRQRIIPIVAPPPNDTLDFATTIGKLYYERKNHTDLAGKKILFWQEHVRMYYHLPANVLNEEFAIKLAHKAGKEETWTKTLVQKLRFFHQKSEITEAEIKELNALLEKFYHH